LYSSAVYNDEFSEFTEPEIVRKPVEDLVLQMKELGIDRLSNFPFPTPPEDTSIKIAENLLVQLGALELDKSRIKNLKDEQVTKITSIGKMMACFPINPRYSKMLVLASQQSSNEKIDRQQLLSYIICLISGLSVPELFIEGEALVLPDGQTEINSSTARDPIRVKYTEMRRSWLNGVKDSHTMLLGDLMLYLVAIGAVEYEEHRQFLDNNASKEICVQKFCETYGIRYKAIVEARKLRKQLTNTGEQIKNIVC
jgi:ATP-dependent RNA helicase DHX37/DHR1